ncbi:MAG: 30S ribosomal protein S15 [Methanosaeta sp. SDB]|nr:MAG: 30S ribosomal protein S15 [Methanosaeta sp. SDB]
MNSTETRSRSAIDELGYHETDTGSSGVQIAILTGKINDLTEHMKSHHKDFRSQRSLRIMVSRRARHLNYLKRTDPQKYREVVSKLGLRK